MKRATTFILFFIFSGILFSQNVFRIDSVVHHAITLEIPWKFHTGDNAEWANPEFDDTGWKTITTRIVTDRENKTDFKDIGWFRLQFENDSSLIGEQLSMTINQHGASEIYLDGKLLYKFGVVSADKTKEEKTNPQNKPYHFTIEKGTSHVLAVRYSNVGMKFHYDRQAPNAGFVMDINLLQKSILASLEGALGTSVIFTFLFGFFISLSLLHFFLFMFHQKSKSNLYYSIFAAGIGFVLFTTFISTYTSSLTMNEKFENINGIVLMAAFLSLLALIYSIFYKKFPVQFKIAAITGISVLVLHYCGLEWVGMGLFVLYFVIAIELIRVVIVSMIKKREGAKIIGTGVIAFMLFILLMIISMLTGYTNFKSTTLLGVLFLLLVILSIISIPISMSLYLAREFSKTNKSLEKKLIEVEELSAKSIEQEKEKQKILESQKETLEIQVEERTVEITEQKKLIEEKNKDITDSINYAKRIQEAILPAKELKYKLFPDAFVLFKPKDIVSGDFYWFAEKNGKRLIASADCTGHGVPGALMSMIGNNFLNEIVNEKGITSPDEILNLLHKEIRKALKQSESSEAKDGMDIALLTFNSETESDSYRIEYAGAQRPLWMIKNNLLEEIKANKFSIGGLQSETERKFTKHKITLTKNDCVYIFSDGFADQFGGAEGKKFMSKQFKTLLLSIHQKPMSEQEKILNDTIDKWKGSVQQIDDILVIGIRI